MFDIANINSQTFQLPLDELTTKTKNILDTRVYPEDVILKSEDRTRHSHTLVRPTNHRLVALAKKIAKFTGILNQKIQPEQLLNYGSTSALKTRLGMAQSETAGGRHIEEKYVSEERENRNDIP